MTQTTVTTTVAAKRSVPAAPRMLSHFAQVTPDAAATVDFYTRVMRMEFVQAVVDDKIPSTGESIPYFHVFFRLGDGSTIAFFEAPGLPPRGPVPHPAYETFDHLALQVDSAAEVDDWQRHLTEQGLHVIGPVDHTIIYSIYFRDPVNDIRLEITTPLRPDWNDQAEAARVALTDWVDAKRTARESARDNGTALSDEMSALIGRRAQGGVET